MQGTRCECVNPLAAPLPGRQQAFAWSPLNTGVSGPLEVGDSIVPNPILRARPLYRPTLWAYEGELLCLSPEQGDQSLQAGP